MNRNSVNKVSLDTDNIVVRRIFALDSESNELPHNHILSVSSNYESLWVNTLDNIKTYGIDLSQELYDLNKRIDDLSAGVLLDPSAGLFVTRTEYNDFASNITSDLSDLVVYTDASLNLVNQRISNIALYINDNQVSQSELDAQIAGVNVRIDTLSNSVPSLVQFNTLSNSVNILSNNSASRILDLSNNKATCNSVALLSNYIYDVSAYSVSIYAYSYATRQDMCNSMRVVDASLNRMNSNINDISGRVNQAINSNTSQVSVADFNTVSNTVNVHTGNIISLTSANNINATNISSLTNKLNSSNVRIGSTAGNTNQGQYSVAIGDAAGNSSQGASAVAIGDSAGYDNQASKAIAIGNSAGYDNQASNAIAIGTEAAKSNQGQYSVAIGNYTGNMNQGQSAVAVGSTAGQISQATNAIAIGDSAGFNNQASNAIAIGYKAGNVNQGTNSIAIGYNAGNTNQQSNSIVLNASGTTVNGDLSNAFFVKPVRPSTNTNTLYYNSSTGEITYAVTPSGGATLPTTSTISAYLYYNGSAWVAGTDNVRLGTNSGSSNQGGNAIAIGNNSGLTAQGGNAVGIGLSAGRSNQGSSAVAVGSVAGYIQQGQSAVAIGDNAANNNQGKDAVAIGHGAGYGAQGSNAVAIGSYAGYSNQHSNSIVLNATGCNLNTTITNSFYVKPVRSLSNTNILYYDSSSGEITYSAPPTTTSSLPVTSTASAYLYYNGSAWVAGTDNVRLGTNSGLSNQANFTVAIGSGAGRTSQAGSAVAIGNLAGNSNQSENSIALGSSAGRESQGSNAIAIGNNAGFTNQATNAVAIGSYAAYSNQHSNSIVLNATGCNLNTTITNSFYVKPIRKTGNTNTLYYDSTSGEITYETAGIFSNTLYIDVSGSSTTPAISFRSPSDTDTGFYHPVDGTILVTTNGSDTMRFAGGGVTVTTEIAIPKIILPSTFSSRSYLYKIPSQNISSSASGWPDGTYVSNLSGINVNNLDLLNAGGISRALWICPVSGLWEVTLHIKSGAEKSDHVAVGNYTKNTPICIGTTTTTTYIASANQLLITGNYRTYDYAGANVQGYLYLKLIMPYVLPYSISNLPAP